MSHTPGPWVIEQLDDGENMDSHIAIYGYPWVVAEVQVDVPSLPGMANANLIAAAPELLEALEDARFALYGNGPGNPKIDAVIAKAKGELK